MTDSASHTRGEAWRPTDGNSFTPTGACPGPRVAFCTEAQPQVVSALSFVVTLIGPRPIRGN